MIVKFLRLSDCETFHWVIIENPSVWAFSLSTAIAHGLHCLSLRNTHHHITNSTHVTLFIIQSQGKQGTWEVTFFLPQSGISGIFVCVINVVQALENGSEKLWLLDVPLKLEKRKRSRAEVNFQVTVWHMSRRKYKKLNREFETEAARMQRQTSTEF